MGRGLSSLLSVHMKWGESLEVLRVFVHRNMLVSVEPRIIERILCWLTILAGKGKSLTLLFFLVLLHCKT